MSIDPVPPNALTYTTTSPDYEKLRTRYFNDRLPNALPACIATPTTTKEVSELIANVKAKGGRVGVRSGGHLFPACSLVDGGLLIDTAKLNQDIEYNPITKIVAFGPATTVRTAAEYLSTINRFFPFGHHPSVGLCGFLLAGGQGWFMRGWGYTADTWVEQLEVVMPNSETILASRNKNKDVFWAARGSGQGFFGVVTRIWVRTIPSKSLFHRTVVLDASKDYQTQLKWMLEKCDATPRYGVDVAIVTSYSDLFDHGDHWESKTKKLLLMVDLTIFADSVQEAATMTSAWDLIDDAIAHDLVMQSPTDPITWEEIFGIQDIIFPHRDRWQCDSILTDKSVSSNEVLRTSALKCTYQADFVNSLLSSPKRQCAIYLTAGVLALYV